MWASLASKLCAFSEDLFVKNYLPFSDALIDPGVGEALYLMTFLQYLLKEVIVCHSLDEEVVKDIKTTHGFRNWKNG